MANFLGVLEDPQCADLYKRWRNRTWLPSPIPPQGTYRIPTEQASVLMTDLLALTPYNHIRGCVCVQCEVRHIAAEPHHWIMSLQVRAGGW